jgi:hypothetical protein
LPGTVPRRGLKPLRSVRVRPPAGRGVCGGRGSSMSTPKTWSSRCLSPRPPNRGKKGEQIASRMTPGSNPLEVKHIRRQGGGLAAAPCPMIYISRWSGSTINITNKIVAQDRSHARDCRKVQEMHATRRRSLKGLLGGSLLLPVLTDAARAAPADHPDPTVLKDGDDYSMISPRSCPIPAWSSGTRALPVRQRHPQGPPHR